MREMKESGVEWIGAIPQNWELIRMKSLIEVRDGGAWGSEEIGEAGDMICLRIADFDYNKYRFTDNKKLTIRHYQQAVIDRLCLKHGDLLVEKSGGGEKTPVGRTVIFDKDYPALFANFMERIRCKKKINPYWMLYNFVNLYANNYTRPYIKQTTGIQNLDIQSLLSSQYIAMPEDEEQKLILNAIYSETGQVDTLISNVEAQIEKLKAYKQSLITEVVTKGLDPTVPMKDSGVEWVKRIPSNWDMLYPKVLFVQRKDRARPNDKQLTASQLYGIMDQEEYMALTGTRVVVVEKDFNILKHVEAGDFVISMRSFQGGLEYSEVSGCISSAYVMLKPSSRRVYSRYYRWLLKSSLYINAIRSTSNLVRDGQAMRYANFIQIWLPCPPMEEQKTIADYLDEKCSQIDRLIAIKQQKIDKLNQYKKSLIYEYVTGKKEVS